MDNKFSDSPNNRINVHNNQQLDAVTKKNTHHQISHDKNNSFRSNYEVEEIGDFPNSRGFNIQKLNSKGKVNANNYDILENKMSKMHFTPSNINPRDQNFANHDLEKILTTHLPTMNNINNIEIAKLLNYNPTELPKNISGYLLLFFDIRLAYELIIKHNF